ncbi:ABC transporter permease [Sphingobacterium faecale]|uniref:ABC transporter permease n=1 Tax=Sphingobacterium faecale TaxID=2803775 RepID=A0ABS1QZQ7_9SPHI|nr:FtsX-like permease family protein [Sphingobacterium faecale]MBL1407929.1 ABC transporter permease [Sphingobacterium faecale]
MNHIKLTLRKLWANRFFTTLNILGLSIGISACWIIFRIVNYELSFDKALPESEDIYQIVNKSAFDGKESGFGGIPLPLYPYMQETLTGIEQLVPVYNRYYEEISIPSAVGTTISFDEPQEIKSTTSAYFDMLPYEWIVGNPKKALSAPNQVVLTLSRVKHYFGNADLQSLVGKTLLYDSTIFTISGVVKDLKSPSSFTAKEFMPIPKEELKNEQWSSANSDHKLYLKVSENSKAPILKNINAKVAEMNAEKFKKYHYKVWFDLLPLSQKHFAQEYASGEYTADKKIILGLSGIGIFLLILACINYVNLSTAQLPYRAKEIGIRKTLGEKGQHLTLKFALETLCICGFALLLSIPLVSYFTWQYNDFLPNNIQDFNTPVATSIFLTGLILAVTLLSSIYPTFLINKVKVIDVLKVKSIGNLTSNGISLRKVLIVFQFVIAQFFVVGTFIITAQIAYMMDSDLGFEKSAIVSIAIPQKAKHEAHASPFLYKHAIEQHTEIQDIALGHQPLDNSHWGNNLVAPSDTGEIRLNLAFKYTDADYLSLYKIKLLAGRNTIPGDTVGSVFINESARKALGFISNEEAAGKNISDHSGAPLRIQGIFQDFHSKNLHTAVGPLALMVTNNKYSLRTFNIRLPDRPSQWPKAIAILEKEWVKIYPKAPFIYSFYDDELKTFYESDVKQSRIINLATAITIILSCLGLIGLVTVTAYQRTKEIGIRKVLGSTVFGIISLLSREYIKLIIIALFIALPIAYWIMSKWLEGFAYRIDIQPWTLVLAGCSTLLIALLSVGYQALMAAKRNPVESLKDE